MYLLLPSTLDPIASPRTTKFLSGNGDTVFHVNVHTLTTTPDEEGHPIRTLSNRPQLEDDASISSNEDDGTVSSSGLLQRRGDGIQYPLLPLERYPTILCRDIFRVHLLLFRYQADENYTFPSP